MKFGALVFQTDLSAGITDIARAVEESGLESLFVVQSTHIPVTSRDLLHGVHRDGAHLLDPFAALGAAAAVTSRLKLGTGVCLVAQHDPIVLARQVATLDHLSGGRFLFGIGAGWRDEEMRNHGVDPRLRWRVMREKVLAMQAIWTRGRSSLPWSIGRFRSDPVVAQAGSEAFSARPGRWPRTPQLAGGGRIRGRMDANRR